MIVLIDHRDSFVQNLARCLRLCGAATTIVPHDDLDDDALAALKPTHLVFSPGPCGPHQAQQSLAVVRQWAGRLPMLGVCLGHQIIAQAFGARVAPNGAPVHGMGSAIYVDDDPLFAGLSNPFQAGRYHSLAVSLPVDADPSCPLRAIARTDDGAVMALRHDQAPIWGVQFHPESILTPEGLRLLHNFTRF